MHTFDKHRLLVYDVVEYASIGWYSAKYNNEPFGDVDGDGFVYTYIYNLSNRFIQMFVSGHPQFFCWSNIFDHQHTELEKL